MPNIDELEKDGIFLGWDYGTDNMIYVHKCHLYQYDRDSMTISEWWGNPTTDIEDSIVH